MSALGICDDLSAPGIGYIVKVCDAEPGETGNTSGHKGIGCAGEFLIGNELLESGHPVTEPCAKPEAGVCKYGRVERVHAGKSVVSKTYAVKALFEICLHGGGGFSGRGAVIAPEHRVHVFGADGELEKARAGVISALDLYAALVINNRRHLGPCCQARKKQNTCAAGHPEYSHDRSPQFIGPYFIAAPLAKQAGTARSFPEQFQNFKAFGHEILQDFRPDSLSPAVEQKGVVPTLH